MRDYDREDDIAYDSVEEDRRPNREKVTPIKKVDIYDMDNCPACGITWVGAEIPKEHRENYGNKTHFKQNIIGVEYAYGTPDRYDGVSEWLCSNCHARWGRWTGKRLQDGETEKRFGGK